MSLIYTYIANKIKKADAIAPAPLFIFLVL